MFPELIVVRRGQILFVVAGILPDLRCPALGNTVHCIFVLCPVSGILFLSVLVHSEISFHFMDSVCEKSENIPF